MGRQVYSAQIRVTRTQSRIGYEDLYESTRAGRRLKLRCAVLDALLPNLPREGAFHLKVVRTRQGKYQVFASFQVRSATPSAPFCWVPVAWHRFRGAPLSVNIYTRRVGTKQWVRA